MTIRITVEHDLDDILALLGGQSLDTATPQRYLELRADRSYRHEWTWIAEDGDRVVALAIWWGLPDRELPLALDGLYADPAIADPVPLWTELIRRAVRTVPPDAEQPEYHLFLPSGWRDQPEVVAALEPRLTAAAAAGLSEITERLRYEWTPAGDLPARSGRLRFRPADDEAFLAVFARVAEGSLDAATLRAVARLGVAGAAKEDLEIYTSMPGQRSWWRLAVDDAGEVVGFAIPSANQGGPVVGYLGVVPEHRGRGYSDDLLAEITHELAGVIQRGEARAPRITADTDLGNQPMAAAFERAGYRNFAVRLVASPPLTPASDS